MRGFSGIVVAGPVVPYVSYRRATGLVRGSGSSVAYIDIDGFVIGLTGGTIPPMPNGIVVTQRRGLGAFQTGSPVDVGPDEIRSGEVKVSLFGARTWDPHVPQWVNAGEGLRGTGQDIWWRLRLARTDDPAEMVERLSRSAFEVASEADGRAGMEALFRSLGDRDPELARRAAALLIGRGPGLTPEGDDFLAAAAATIFACEPSIGWSPKELAAWRSAVLPDDLRERTTALSATLLELAVDGFVSEPVQTLFDLNAPFKEWHGELNRLKKVGHGTGRAWAAGCAATAILLTR